jgi:hypothetical protein
MGNIMKDAPFDAKKLGIFLGWEALKDSEILRDCTLEGLLVQIDNL